MSHITVEILEQGGLQQLDGETVALTREYHPVSGTTLEGPRGLYNNGNDPSAPRTILAYGTGVGYLDRLTVTDPHKVTLTDPTQATNYPINGLAYFFRADGAQDGTGVGQLRTLRTVLAVSGGELTLDGPPLDTRLTAGKWYTNAAAIGDVRAGLTAIQANIPVEPGDDVTITQGPEPFNNARDEWHRVVAVASGAIALDSPLRRDYRNAVIAKANTVRGVTMRNVHLLPPTVNGDIYGFHLQLCTYWLFENVTFAGKLDLADCAYMTFNNCTFASLQLNAIHDCIFNNCTLPDTILEECCFRNQFKNCTYGPHSNGAAMGATASGNHDNVWEGGVILGPSAQAMGIVSDDSLIQGIKVAPNAGDIFAIGNRMRLHRINTDGSVFMQAGYDMFAEDIEAQHLYLGGLAGRYASGTTVNCPTAQRSSGQWQIIDTQHTGQ